MLVKYAVTNAKKDRNFGSNNPRNAEFQYSALIAKIPVTISFFCSVFAAPAS